MIVLFLDVDQVLNTRLGSLDEDKLDLLRYVVVNTGAKLVLSSTWRKSGLKRKQLEEALRARGMDLFADTPDLNVGSATSIILAVPRYREIKAYIAASSTPITAYCILDDDSGADDWSGRWVRTYQGVGLTPVLAEQAVQILLTPIPNEAS